MLLGMYTLISVAVSLGICWITGSFGEGRWMWLLPALALGLLALLCLGTFLYLLYLCPHYFSEILDHLYYCYSEFFSGRLSISTSLS